MTKWSKIRKGDRVELKGREYEVVRIKSKGASAKVTVLGKAGSFESKVPLDGKVSLVADPLHGKGGEQRRWAKPAEAKALDKSRAGVVPGDPAITKPPGKLSADPWETRRDSVERRLDELLGAQLVGEASDEGAGYYVPPVDLSTVAAHLALLHGLRPADYGSEAAMLAAHAERHEAALSGAATPLKVNHWHTETRPRA